MWFGFVLIVVGVVLLLQNLGILSADAWNIIWPVLVILLGIALVIKSFRRR